MRLFGWKKHSERKEKKFEFSKRLINDNRYLLWVINVGGLLLAFCCIFMGYVGGLGWIAGMVSSSWVAHGAICSWYFSLAKQDHRGADGTGITFATAQANGFVEPKEETSWESPKI